MPKADDTDSWLSEIDLPTVFAMLRDNGATGVLYKILPRNANSKNQVYLASDLSQLGKIPSGEVTLHVSTSQKSGVQEAVFRSALDFHWLGRNGQPIRAPHAKLIFYPQYPEVRFSGFLQGCKDAPSSLWVKDSRGEEPDRILVLGIGNGTRIFGITLPPESPAAREIRASEPHDAYGVLNILPMPGQDEGNGFLELMRELCRIHRRGWVPSTRLDPLGNLIPCNASNCNGNTLESLLGIRSNGYSLPDFRGWEVKARQVPNADKPGASVVTLFTPEPTSGIYMNEGVIEFIRRYGYADTRGRDDRLNFGGIYRASNPAHDRTGLRLVLDGFNAENGKYSSAGAIQLLDRKDNVAAAWPFVKLMDHWKAKHAHAAFVPAEQRMAPERQYRYGNRILLGEGAEFGLFLKAAHEGKIYYDPGIKLEGVSTPTPKPKKRSQFRVASKDLPALYTSSRIVDACSNSP
ncbi:MvaI/BcnI restriction endonuclease family protein [Flavobacterium sp. MXW15]|uniref:MvaI/BcnI restriction endonuclease family protein n=1 Tax=Xanthomonas chitinilytica TaxID=2989819 RepID=A0ABT3JWX6_9XANT|nr:MvaI/BcnI restriction endonuclease family protein [Xanthomonas sp. H13-6]MCW4455773.1 MvaI/BcnI restriction endonuclease family protein [Flavobacterium sp. MXW15]MCW4472989.1 MvaI/BcnI restriction endonuclease family protein [Xanthomonas sp. H13-6]